jgi:nucleotide-binding universal stress UspA family protein
MAEPVFQRLLVPLDGSERAERALEYAAKLAGPLDVSVTLIRAVPAGSRIDDARRYLHAAAGRLAAARIAATVEVGEGDPVAVILDAERPGDLLVMATHGATGLERFLLGGVSDRVLRYCAAPVFLARAFRPVAPDLSPIVVPLDGSEFAEQVLPYVRHLAGRLAAEVRLLRAVYVRPFDSVAYPPELITVTLEWEREEGARYIAGVAAALAAEGLRVRSRFTEAEPYQAIAEEAGETPGGFIAMTTRGRSGLVRTLLGSVAARVSEAAADPVFLVKP